MKNNMIDKRIFNEIKRFHKQCKPYIDAVQRIQHSSQLKELADALGQISCGYNDSFRRVGEYILNVQKQFNEILSQFNFNIDFNKVKRNLFIDEFKEREELVKKCEEQNIFPPIMFLCEKEIYKIDKETLLEEFIYNKELKQFYLNKINEWKDKFEDDVIDSFIEEIYFNFKYNNFYSVSSLIFILLEYLLRQGYEIDSKGMYGHIKSILRSEVFEPIGIMNLYYKFIENNLYSNTDKAENFSRHALHGEKIECLTDQTAYNVIFIYDFIQEIITVSKVEP